MSTETETLTPPKTREVEEEQDIELPQYHVVLLDDDEHTYAYVIEMLMQLFGHSRSTAFRMACEVDAAGRVRVETTTKERAELKKDQIEDFGPDWRLEHSTGSMGALVEPAD